MSEFRGPGSPQRLLHVAMQSDLSRCPRMDPSWAHGWGAPHPPQDLGPVSSSPPGPFKLSPPDRPQGPSQALPHPGPPSHLVSLWVVSVLPSTLCSAPQDYLLSSSGLRACPLSGTVHPAVRVDFLKQRVTRPSPSQHPSVVLISHEAPSPVTQGC